MERMDDHGSSMKKDKKKKRRRSNSDVDALMDETSIGTEALETSRTLEMDDGGDVKSSSSSKKEERKKMKMKKKRSETNVDADDAPSDELSVKLDTFAESSNKIAPVIGYFPSGFDPLKQHKHKGEEHGGGSNTKIRVFRNARFSNRLQVVVSPEQSKVEYIGNSYLGEAAAPQVCTYALGVLDKETQMLKIVPVVANKLFEEEFLQSKRQS